MEREFNEVVSAVLVAANRVLLVHRNSSRTWAPDAWDAPGGHVEPGESDFEALGRELREELGIVVIDAAPVPIARLTGADFDQRIFSIISWSGEPENIARDEHDDLRWLSRDELDDVELADEDLRAVLIAVLAAHSRPESVEPAGATTSPSFTAEHRRLLMNGLGLMSAGANVIMQLSRLAIGHGVAESIVESGSLHRHPIKRTRTTLGYIMIALFGTEYEREVLRAEVNRQHRLVSSDGPVAYSAFDPELQLWVAACMYRGVEDSIRTMNRVVTNETLDVLYLACARFATTLQVPEARWPVDRGAFEEYWASAVREISTDETTRTYLLGIAELDFLPRPLGRLFGPVHRFVTTGFLSPPFREELGLSWTDTAARRFALLVKTLRTINHALPDALRELPWNVVLFDTRRRIHSGRPIV